MNAVVTIPAAPISRPTVSIEVETLLTRLKTLVGAESKPEVWLFWDEYKATILRAEAERNGRRVARALRAERMVARNRRAGR